MKYYIIKMAMAQVKRNNSREHKVLDEPISGKNKSKSGSKLQRKTSIAKRKTSSNKTKNIQRPKQLVNQRKLQIQQSIPLPKKKIETNPNEVNSITKSKNASRVSIPANFNPLKNAMAQLVDNKVKDYKQEWLLSKFSEFYSKKSNVKKMLPIIQGESDISLRILDWFITNYSNKKNVFYELKDKKGDPYKFFVHQSYQDQLKAYSKKQFDPFCRRKRIEFQYDPKHTINTTIGQLNFFRWAIEFKVLDYVKKNLSSIEKDMNNSIKHYNRKKIMCGGETDNPSDDNEKSRIPNGLTPSLTIRSNSNLPIDFVNLVKGNGNENGNRIGGSKRKKKELSLSTNKKISHHNIEFVIRFD